MLGKKILAVSGFAIGSTLVLLTSNPLLFTNPDSSPTPEAQLLLPVPTESASETKTPVIPSATATTAATPKATLSSKPTVSATPKVTISPKPAPASITIAGAIYSAGKYGDVQVQITVINGYITSAKALAYPSADSRSSSISAVAIPILIEQTVSAKNSADIAGATGASYTSTAWIQSLQSALAKI